MENGLYTAHEVAEIIADLFGDTCACNFNGIDEWLPFKCELVDSCPNTYGVACWEQYLKYRHCKAVKSILHSAKPIDAVPVVRCGKCKHFRPYEGEEHKGDYAELVGLESCVYKDDFCSTENERTVTEMADMMNFPKRWEDFLHDYEFEDARRIYTNGLLIAQAGK